MTLTVMGVLETREGLELIVEGNGKTLTATIPQEVAEINAKLFTATMLDKSTLRIVYQGDGCEKTYEAAIKT